MKKLLLILLIPFISYTQTQIGEDIDGEAANDLFGYCVSLSSNGNLVAIGAPGNDENGVSSGNVRVFEFLNGAWEQIGNNIGGETNGDASGSSISLSSNGNFVAIGAPYIADNNSFSGYTRVYQNINNEWTQIGNTITGESLGDHAGCSVSISGDGSIVAIGAKANDGNGTDSGHIRIYENINGAWSQIGNDINGEAFNDQFGISVSLSGDGNIVAVGAIGNDGNGAGSGHVQIYENQGGVWVQIGSDIDGEASGDSSGYSVSLSIDGTIIAIGAPGNNGSGLGSGHVRVFEYIGGIWTQIGSDIDGEFSGDFSGIRISLSSNGRIVAIGATDNDGNGDISGQTRIYHNQAGEWVQLGDDIDGESEGDFSGYNVSIANDGSAVAIGAIFNNANGSNAGHVRVYDLSAVLASNSFVEENFNVYPNPVSEFLTIELKDNFTLESVRFYNSLGELVKTSSLSIINVSELASGTYFIQVATNEGNATKTIIIE